MSKCNFTQYVSPNLCIGDSLAAFNSNFAKLDEGLCNVPAIQPGPGVSVSTHLTEQEDTVLRLGVKKTISSFGNNEAKFDYRSNTADSDVYIPLNDGTVITTTQFSQITATSQVNDSNYSNPLATICTTIPSRGSIPKLTLFWTANGGYDYTLYNTNSANSLQFNGAVTALLSSANGIYVGGDFTSVGGQTNRKFCVLSLTKGVTSGNVLYGKTGGVISNPLTAVNEDLGSFGRVNAIAEIGQFLIIGGSFRSLTRGKGLLIYNKSTKEFFPFYVNGVVHDIQTGSATAATGGYESVIYVGGRFDYINYGSESASDISGIRVYTNGLVKISLNKILLGYPNSSIDKTFASNQASLYTGPATINTIVAENYRVYIGGSFEIRKKYRPTAPTIPGTRYVITAKNIALINETTGDQVTDWKPILNGEVYSMKYDPSDPYIYVGGAFTEYFTNTQLYTTPRPADETINASGLIVFSAVTNEGGSQDSPIFVQTWRPQFNGPVTNIDVAPGVGSYVYCLGLFSLVDGNVANGSAVITKAKGNTGAVFTRWDANLSRAPLPNSTALAYIPAASGVFVGGAFSHANSSPRQSLAHFTGANNEFIYSNTKPVIWQVGAQTYSHGQPFDIDTTSYVSTSAYSGPYGTINRTELNINPDSFKYSADGDYVRFFIRRPKNNDKFPHAAYVVGWKLEFN